jgi:hypothetical protein
MYQEKHLKKIAKNKRQLDEKLAEDKNHRESLESIKINIKKNRRIYRLLKNQY